MSTSTHTHFKRPKQGAQEKARQLLLTVLTTVLTEDPGPILPTPTQRLATAWNSTPWGVDNSFPVSKGSCTHELTQAHVHTLNEQKKICKG